jgi:hypothetical protein
MPKTTAGCCNTDELIVRPGAGIDVSGSGTAADPYIVTTTVLDFSESLSVRDSDTVDLQLTGSGNPGDPFILKAQAAIKMANIADIQDPAGPNNGDVPLYVTDHWEFGPPPANPGAVNVTGGILGTGAVSTPLKVAVAATWGTGELAGLGTDTTSGQPTYIDSTGVLRVKPVSITSVSWDVISGKPLSFPPVSHSHLSTDIQDPQNLSVGKINGKRITTATSSSTKPASPAVGDVFIFPKGS